MLRCVNGIGRLRSQMSQLVAFAVEVRTESRLGAQEGAIFQHFQLDFCTAEADGRRRCGPPERRIRVRYDRLRPIRTDPHYTVRARSRFRPAAWKSSRPSTRVSGKTMPVRVQIPPKIGACPLNEVNGHCRCTPPF
jgi:hypothetical protein